MGMGGRTENRRMRAPRFLVGLTRRWSIRGDPPGPLMGKGRRAVSSQLGRHTTDGPPAEGREQESMMRVRGEEGGRVGSALNSTAP